MPTLHELNCLLKGTFMWSHSRWCVSVGCRNLHLGLLRPRPPNFPTHVDAFISIFGGFRCISWCGLVFSFQKKKNKNALGVLFCIFAFFVQYWGEGLGEGCGSCSSPSIFLWSKQWEGALLLCAVLATTGWLGKRGFYTTRDTDEAAPDQITQITKTW